MTCAKKMGSSAKVITGGIIRYSASEHGLSRTTSQHYAARATLPHSSASQTQPFFSGCESMGSNVAPCQEHGGSSIGAFLGPTTPCGASEANSIRDGLAVSRLNAKRFTRVSNGKRLAQPFGGETKRAAASAGNERQRTGQRRSTFTTSSHSPSNGCALIQTTSCCFAKPATASCIRGGM